MFFFKLSPIGVFFFSSILVATGFTFMYCLAYFYGEISISFLFYAFFSEFFFLFSDLLFCFIYCLYVTTHPGANLSANETHLFIAKWVGKFVPLWFTNFIQNKFFPFFTRYVVPFILLVRKIKNFFKNYINAPATLKFICACYIFFLGPLLYFFYQLDVLLETCQFPWDVVLCFIAICALWLYWWWRGLVKFRHQ